MAAILDLFGANLDHLRRVLGGLYILQMIDLKFFFQYLKGRCYGNQFCGKIGAKLPTPALIALLFRNGIGYLLANTRVYSSANCSTSCEKMVKIGSVVFELKWGRK